MRSWLWLLAVLAAVIATAVPAVALTRDEAPTTPDTIVVHISNPFEPDAPSAHGDGQAETPAGASTDTSFTILAK